MNPSQLDRLLDIMTLLRDPQRGCPWDVKQNFRSIAPHTIEEAYEVAEAIERDDMDGLCDELGDLLLQVVFHAQIARESGFFEFDDVATAICDKLVRRHPHVFAGATVNGAAAQTRAWESHKADERRAKAGDSEAVSALDGVTVALPALTRAFKLQKRAARTGFDWPAADQILAKFAEEIRELEVERADGAENARLEDEIGDLLFTCVNLARKLAIDPETALRHGNAKFAARFRRMEALLAADGTTVENTDMKAKETYWNRAKADLDGKI